MKNKPDREAGDILTFGILLSLKTDKTSEDNGWGLPVRDPSPRNLVEIRERKFFSRLRAETQEGTPDRCVSDSTGMEWTGRGVGLSFPVWSTGEWDATKGMYQVTSSYNLLSDKEPSETLLSPPFPRGREGDKGLRRCTRWGQVSRPHRPSGPPCRLEVPEERPTSRNGHFTRVTGKTRRPPSTVGNAEEGCDRKRRHEDSYGWSWCAQGPGGVPWEVYPDIDTGPRWVPSSF